MLENDPVELFKKLSEGNNQALARCITLSESVKESHQEIAESILEKAFPHSGNSMRIGITGVPGVGKSTFIEAFGQYLIEEKNKKVAVLAIDPSSIKSKGSILGDKTRMSSLSANESAFIRPSPSSGTLGGVALATRETIILCEAAGYDVIIVETVGVGQSETEVKELVDFFMLLMLPGAGDELQGIKRGIVELADAIFINKSDGDNLNKAKEAKAAYSNALHLFPPVDSGWTTIVETCSSLDSTNIDLAWQSILSYEELTKSNHYFNSNRNNQLECWLKNAIENRILKKYLNQRAADNYFADLKNDIISGKISPRKASRLFLSNLSAG